MRGLSFILILFIVSCNSSESPKKGSELLLSPEEVFSLIEGGNTIRLIELSNQESYSKGHLPNAILLQRNDYRDTSHSVKGMMASKSEMENLLQRLAINEGDTLIMYGEHANVDACRFFWVLERYGHPSIYIMDGGKKAWEESYELTTQIPSIPEKSAYKFPDYEITFEDRASINDVHEAMLDEKIQIVDTRSMEEYMGQPFINKGEIVHWKKGAKINGTIPGAIHFHWTKIQQYEMPFGFKSKKDIIHEFNSAGIDPNGEIIVFCQSGARSSHTLFALKHILGNQKVKNYDGSWIEWSTQYAEKQDYISQLSSDKENAELFDKLKQEIVNNDG